MKKNLLPLLAICLFTNLAFAGNTPVVTQKAFEQKFPGASKVKWGKESPTNYEASFELNGIHYSANFSDTGEWLETESPITFEQLPEKVRTAFNSTHKNLTPKDVSKIETSKQGVIYELEIKKGLKTVELFYKEDGTVTKE